jgi:hypothetical protein
MSFLSFMFVESTANLWQIGLLRLGRAILLPIRVELVLGDFAWWRRKLRSRCDRLGDRLPTTRKPFLLPVFFDALLFRQEDGFMVDETQ